MRAITHIHTERSWDSRVQAGRLADVLTRHHIELALVCDHNDFGGSLALRSLAAARGLDLLVPVAAEIRTDRGDVIVVFDHGEPPPVDALLAWPRLRDEVRRRGGLIWLPHPYQSHTGVEELASDADVIEVFNARCSRRQNEQAVDLCERHGAVPAYGADAHRLTEVGRFVVDYEPASSVVGALRTAPTCQQPVPARRSDVMAAEVINGVTRRRPALVGYNLLRWAVHRARERSGPVAGGDPES